MPTDDPNGEARAAKVSDSGEDRMTLGVSVDYRRMFGGDFKSFTQGRLSGEFLEGDRHGPALFIFGGALELDEDSLAHEIAHDPTVIGFGLGYRYYFTRRHTFIRPYGTVEVAFSWITWRYRDEVVSANGFPSGDSTEGVDGYLGAGVILGSDKVVNVFGEIGTGGGFFLGTTNEGLKNDFLGAYSYLGARLGLRFRF
jgi:hypothetical protein